MNKQTQNARILRWLKRRGLTRRAAMLNLGIGNLPQRIAELREDGHRIKCDMITRRGSRYGVYRLKGE